MCVFTLLGSIVWALFVGVDAKKSFQCVYWMDTVAGTEARGAEELYVIV